MLSLVCSGPLGCCLMLNIAMSTLEKIFLTVDLHIYQPIGIHTQFITSQPSAAPFINFHID